ncbi:cation:proton antiporter [Opitutus terrae]|uniref:Sodium/hydrogen exchanger n=1 Tax=Opitutus terrae (strain DSM 11246 / JCM 15787 / PB90-1) TaxID=452637 RepID=B1ZQU7_OPITP|nr:cation:proton antiporter [Opitutus terrae]ACB77845.1 sodium/hydrogen exchanger [Opitutus terrae PB90-1]
MESISLIQDLATLLLAAGVAGALCRRIGLSVIVGYLVAGILIGPHTPPFSLIVDEARIMALSQVGLVFLIFSIGLGLSLSKFGRMGAATLIATGIGAFLVLNLTQLLGLVIGWTPLQAMFVAAMLMVSSSAVIAKIVHELKLSHERSSQIALAITVLEDVVAVTMLTVLGSQTQAGASEGVGSLLGGLGAFVVLLVGAGLLFVPRLLRRLEARADPEMQTIIVAGVLCLLALAAAAAGYSTALGAFLFGALVAEIPQKRGVETSFAGIRDLFSSVFFVSIGMMIDVRLMLDVWPLTLGLAAFALIARPIAVGIAMVLVGMPPDEARRASLLLTPLGEFSFIIAQLGVSTAVLPSSFYPVAVGASILTVLATPLLGRHRDRILQLMDRWEPRWFKRTIDAYHGWMQQLRERPDTGLTWRLVRGRLVQIFLEVLFVSGVLIYSRQLLHAIQSSWVGERVEEGTLGYAFWGVITVVVLIPLLAIWRNCATVAMILGESIERRRLPRALVERSVKAFALLLMGYWLYAIVPHDALPRWGWLVVAGIAAVFVGVFSRRLVYWHSEWQSSMREVLADNRGNIDENRALARATLGESLSEWNLNLSEVVVPDTATYAGQTLAELSIPARTGCSVVEIERNGYPIPSPGPGLAVFAGDKLLLLGDAAQLASASKVLSAAQPRPHDAEGFEAAILETCRVSAHRAGQTLAELNIARRTGVRVVGIQRGEQRILNPTAQERLEEGDGLLVIGTLTKIREFRRWFAGTGEPRAAA